MAVDPLASWMWSRLTEPPLPQPGHVLVNVDALEKSGPEMDDKVLLPVSSSDANVEVGSADVPVLKPGDGDPLSWDVKDNVAEADAESDAPLDGFVDGQRQLLPSANDSIKERPWIWRVHPSVRDKDTEAYDPKLVSIGPLHHGTEALKPMEEVKQMYVNFFLDRSPKINKMANYVRVIRNCQERARRQYAEPIKMPPKADFVKMLVRDGCFLIEYMLRWYVGPDQTIHPDLLVHVGWDFSLLRRDLMLLENQIPFFVLDELFRASDVPNRAGTIDQPLSLMTIALHFLKLGGLPKEKHPETKEVYHLLHLQYICLKPDGLLQPAGLHSGSSSVLMYPMKRLSGLLSYMFYGLLFMLLINEWPWTRTQQNRSLTIPCATDLVQFGVKLKSKRFREDEVDNFLNVTFSEGVLEVPFLQVSQSTNSQLRNYVAFERCQKIGNHFTEYVIFMDNIIDTVNDVKILQRHGIIESVLGSDEQVAKTFNLLLEGTHISQNQHVGIGKLFKSVEEYCEIPKHRWRASLRSSYLRSPWATISLLAATITVVTSLMQTFFSFSRAYQN